MFSCPFRKLGRSVLAASVISLGALSLGAQTTATAPAPPAGPNPSRVDVFMGYSYFGAHGTLKPLGAQYSSIDLGAIGSVAYYFNRYFGGEVSFAAHPRGQNDGLYVAAAGPIFRAPMQNFTLFAHGLVGAGDLVGPNNDTPAAFGHNPYRWGPSLTAGGGMDYDLPFFNHLFGLRLFQADYVYVHESYGPYTAPPTIGNIGGRANLGGAQLSTGILLHFGHIVPPPPVMYACVASPISGYPGDPITITGTGTNLNPKKDAAYTWTADGGTIAGTSSTANIDTKTAAPGSYTAKGHVSQGVKAGQFADCAVPYTVMAFQPPTLSCSSNPSSVRPGDSSTITASGVSPQNRPLTYSYSASGGSVSGSSSTATLSTAGAGPGTITVTCNVVDDKGQTASATTTVDVTAPSAPPAVQTSSLCSINFGRDTKRPARVDNEAKACLDDVALNLQRSSDAKVALTGNKGASEKGAKLASERAVNTKAYLVTEKGIDPSRISVYTGTTDANTVTTTLIPSGATLGDMGTMIDESSVKAQSRTAPVTKHKKHKK